MATTISTQQERQPWSLSGTRRGTRASYVITLLKTFDDRTIEQIIDDIGWSDPEGKQVRADTLSLLRYILNEPDDVD